MCGQVAASGADGTACGDGVREVASGDGALAAAFSACWQPGETLVAFCFRQAAAAPPPGGMPKQCLR